MGCVGSNNPSGPKPQTEKNTQKIFCLGVGGCGKTTFVKQMKIMYQTEWKEEELQTYTKILRANFITGTQELLDMAKKANSQLAQENDKHVAAVKAIRPRNPEFTDDLIDALKAIWEDKAIQEIAATGESHLAIPQLPWLFDNIDRILKNDYVPTNDDILRARQRTAGANSTPIYIAENKIYFEFFDMGGQKPERAKWDSLLSEHKFSAVLFFVATDEFDVQEEGNMKLTKLETSKLVFEELVTGGSLPDGIPVVIMLNRKDLLDDRISQKKGLKEFKAIYDDFDGKTTDDVLKYIKQMFLKTVSKKVETNGDDAIIKCHNTCVLDTKAMETIWESVSQFLLRKALAKHGLM